MPTQSLLGRAEVEAMAAGLSISDIGGSLGADELGDGHVTGRLGPLLLRFVRDRGQDWLEVRPTDARPPRFYSFHDVQIALGWKTASQVLDLQDVEPLGDVLSLLASRWSEITQMLSGESSSLGWRRVEKAAHERGEDFAARLR